MKTLFISYFFPPCTEGAATLVHNLCKYMPKDCYRVITAGEELGIFCWNNLGAYDKDYHLDSDVIRLPVKTNKLKDRIMFFLLTLIHGVIYTLRRETNCFLAVYPDEFDLFSAYFLHLLTGKPHLVYMHDLYSEVRRNARLYKFWKLVEKKILSSARAVLVTNRRFKEYYATRGFDNVLVLSSCVDIDEYEAFTSDDPSTEGPLKIVFTGSIYLTNEDVIICLLNATKKMKNIKLVVSTPHKKDFLKEANIGFLSKKDCRKLQKNSDVLFLPLSFSTSVREEIKIAFPIKSLEYFAAGKPILAVVPKDTFVAELITEYDAGLVVTELSEEKIIESIEQLMDKDRRRQFSENSSRAALYFDAKVQSKKLCFILKMIQS